MSSASAEQRFELVGQRYGDRLTPEQLEQVKLQVDRMVELAEALRTTGVDPREEPMAVFTPYHVEGS